MSSRFGTLSNHVSSFCHNTGGQNRQGCILRTVYMDGSLKRPATFNDQFLQCLTSDLPLTHHQYFRNKANAMLFIYRLWMCFIRVRTSSAVALPVFTMKLACSVEISAPPIRVPLSPLLRLTVLHNVLAGCETHFPHKIALVVASLSCDLCRTPLLQQFPCDRRARAGTPHSRRYRHFLQNGMTIRECHLFSRQMRQLHRFPVQLQLLLIYVTHPSRVHLHSYRPLHRPFPEFHRQIPVRSILAWRLRPTA